MNITKQYEELVKQLGDTCYKLQVLEKKKSELIAEIKKLDDVAGYIHAQKSQAQKGNAD